MTQTDYFYAEIYRITRSNIFGIFVSSLNVFLLTPVIFSVHSTLCHIEEGSTLNSNDELVKVKTAMKLKNCNNYPHFSHQKKNKWALPFISHLIGKQICLILQLWPSLFPSTVFCCGYSSIGIEFLSQKNLISFPIIYLFILCSKK